MKHSDFSKSNTIMSILLPPQWGQYNEKIRKKFKLKEFGNPNFFTFLQTPELNTSLRPQTSTINTMTLLLVKWVYSGLPVDNAIILTVLQEN